AYCGLIGLKQSRGRIPAGPGRSEGNNGLSASFVLTRSARDCALCLDIMNGPAQGDPYSITKPERPYREEIMRPLKKMHIAYTNSSWIKSPLGKDSKKAVHTALRKLEAEGHTVEEATPDYDIEAFIMATTVVACANLARDTDVIAARLGRKVDEATLQSTTLECYRYGKQISATQLLDALGVFNTVNRSVGHFFARYDLFVTPTNLQPAPVIDKYYRSEPSEPFTAESWQSQVFENDSFLATFNTTGQPAISLPLDETNEGIPVGVQFASQFGDEATLIRLAAFFEEALPWGMRKPQIHVSKRIPVK
ncbi:MAG: amidase, partial [Rhodospirillales bacterium]|nr:amidase [Rhodospirillales bacterium]